MLLGSSVLPSHVWINGEQRQLGDVVRHAFVKSGLTTDEWNAVPALEREFLLVRAAYEMMGKVE